MSKPIKGTKGNDTLVGTSVADVILGLAGNDTISGGQGADTINAGAGNDLVIVNAGDAAAGEMLDGGNGVDTLELKSGADLSPDDVPTHFEIIEIVGSNSISGAQLANFGTISTYYSSGTTLTGSSAGTFNFAGKSVSSYVQFFGSSGADSIVGSSDGNFIGGGQGADTIKAGDGNDTVYIRAGDASSGESLDGGMGNDTLELGSGADLSPDNVPTGFETLEIVGGNLIGAKQLANFGTISTYYSGGTTLTASASGTFNFAGKSVSSYVQFFGSGGADSIVGSSDGNFISGGQGADTIKAGDGNDTVYVRVGDASSGESLDGGMGNDTLELGSGADLSPDNVPTGFETLEIVGGNFIGAPQLANFDTISTYYSGGTTLTASASGTFNFAGKSVSSYVQFFGSGGADSIVGSSDGNFLSGGQGADTIKAGDGNDTVYIRSGDASLGESLDGGMGNDTLELGSGADLSPDNVPTGFETLEIVGGNLISAAQLVNFGAISTYYSGGTTLTGSAAGTFNFAGKAVSSYVQFYGSSGADSIVGSGSGQYLAGGQGNDSITAGDGNDTLVGGLGSDRLTGGAGDDIFYMAKGDAVGDAITDFTGAGVAGGDTLTLHGYGSGATLSFDGGSSYTIHFSGGSEGLTIISNAPLASGDYVFT